MPTQIECDEKQHYQTNNCQGFMHPISSLSRQFIEFSVGKQVIDIGCAYGNIVMDALKVGAKNVTACGVEQTHLDVVCKQVAGTEFETKLTTVCGEFPDGLNFSAEAFDGIHTSHLLNLFTGEELERGLANCYAWLKPDGRLFIVVYSIYSFAFDNEKFKVEYQRRKQSGMKWPGYLENFESYCRAGYAVPRSETEPDKKMLPDNLHVLELNLLVDEMRRQGFTIDYADYIDGKANGAGPSVWLDGREYIAIIATK